MDAQVGPSPCSHPPPCPCPCPRLCALSCMSLKLSQVGLLDIDICGPSQPKMLGVEGEQVHQSGLGWAPVYPLDNLGVISIGFLLQQPDEAIIWRGPKKNGMIK
eukprot:392999-Hanusia_phi.AAC.1